MNPKTYLPKSGAKEIMFKDGGSLIKLNLHADTAAAFIKANANERGYINLIVSRRREVSERGETHSIYLDDYKPPQPGTTLRPAAKPTPSGGEIPDDVPF